MDVLRPELVLDHSLAELDPDVAELIDAELARQQGTLEMIASENFAPVSVLAAQGSVLTNKYAEGYPGRRYYGGCEHVDVIERLAIERVTSLFGAGYANVQPHSGAQANAAAMTALLEPGDTILGLDLAHGGHLTHGMRINFSGRLYKAAAYHVRQADYRVDMDEVERLAAEHRPKMIIAGWSAYPRQLDFARFRRIADEVGAYVLVDMAHFAAHGCDITDSRQFDDHQVGQLFLRMRVRAPGPVSADELRAAFAPVAQQHQMRWRLHEAAARVRTVILVSRLGHCLNDLLFRWKTGSLPVDVAGVVSNHEDFRELAASYRVPFRHVPVTKDTKAAAEARLLDIIDGSGAELVVLARYMQILSPEACKRMEGRAINIHHSFLPSFKGGRPYHQAHARGVKLVGATATMSPPTWTKVRSSSRT